MIFIFVIFFFKRNMSAKQRQKPTVSLLFLLKMRQLQFFFHSANLLVRFYLKSRNIFKKWLRVEWTAASDSRGIDCWWGSTSYAVCVHQKNSCAAGHHPTAVPSPDDSMQKISDLKCIWAGNNKRKPLSVRCLRSICLFSHVML